MATYTPDATYSVPSSPLTVDDAAAPRRIDRRRPFVALAVAAMVCAGLGLVPADAAAAGVTVEEFVLLAAGGNQGNQGNQGHPGQGNPCGNTGNPCCDNKGDGNPNEQTPGNAGGGCNPSDDDDSTPPGPQGPSGPVGDDDSTPPGDDDDPATDDDPASLSPAEPTPRSDAPSAPQPPEVLGVVEEHEPEGPSGAQVLGTTERARAVPEALAFTGPAGAVPIALGGSSCMAAGVAMVLAGRRRRPEDVRQAWWERVAL